MFPLGIIPTATGYAYFLPVPHDTFVLHDLFSLSAPAAAVHLIKASATDPLNALRSNSNNPWIVDPPGVATFSFTFSGVSPANASIAAPFIVSAAMVWASERLSPSATAPSSKDSRNNAKKAGVLPQRAVQASNWLAWMWVTVPMAVKR